MSDNLCVVCLDKAQIFAVGECDHIVCYECSMRMRVLCLKSECPICRQNLDMVIFTKNLRSFKKLKESCLEGKLRSEEHKIVFDGREVMNKFRNLLLCYCFKCQHRPVFITMEVLAEHMLKMHHLYRCELCKNSLKLFPFEYRWYSKSKLDRHVKSGDPDNGSYKGHPLCQFCQENYTDKDELYRHLRKEHFYCHMCETDGKLLFYGTYLEMRVHYKSDHYLCEEGDCVTEHLTSVFKTTNDLKAHKSLVHAKSLGKQGLREARTLDVDVNFVSCIGSFNSFHSAPGIYNTPANSSSSVRIPDWNAAFPSLNRTAIETQPRRMVVCKPAAAVRLARTDDNFPALTATVQAGTTTMVVATGKSAKPTVVMTMKKKMKAKEDGDGKKNNAKEDGGGKKNNAKEEGYSWVQKLKTIPEPPPAAKAEGETKFRPPNLSQDFPTLGKKNSCSEGGKLEGVLGQVDKGKGWNTALNKKKEAAITAEAKGTEKARKKAPSREDGAQYCWLPVNARKGTDVAAKSEMKVLCKKQGREVEKRDTAAATNGVGGKKGKDLKEGAAATKEKVMEKEKDSSIKEKKNNKKDSTAAATAKMVKNGTEKKRMVVGESGGTVGPPPGFGFGPPPPGFSPIHRVTSSAAVAPNDRPKHYIVPDNMLNRKKALARDIKSSLEDWDGFCRLNEAYTKHPAASAKNFYDFCKSNVRREKFPGIFSEIVALLPNIEKQKRLWTCYLKDPSNVVPEDVTICDLCKQLLKKKDLMSHRVNHTIRDMDA